VLDGFRLAAPDACLVFLGDYTDRGVYGLEVLYTLYRLVLENPERVILCRGNHEDPLLAFRYGFIAELTAKYGRSVDIRRLMRSYEFLPPVAYVGSGTNLLECHHGGLEPGYFAGGLPDGVQFQFLGTLRQRGFLERNADLVATLPASVRRDLGASLEDFLPTGPTTPAALGFMWNDFAVWGDEAQFAIDPGRALVWGQEATRRILAQAGGRQRRLVGVVRAHQHSSLPNPMMRRLLAGGGLFQHWQPKDGMAQAETPGDKLAGIIDTAEERSVPAGCVWTFNVVPDSVYGAGNNYTFDAFGQLTLKPELADWRWRVIRQEMR
jgi:hypothetical protein